MGEANLFLLFAGVIMCLLVFFSLTTFETKGKTRLEIFEIYKEFKIADQCCSKKRAMLSENLSDTPGDDQDGIFED